LSSLRKKKLIVLGLVAVSIVVLFFIDWQREKESYSTKKKKEKEEIPLLSVKGVNLVGWNSEGEKSWRVEADSGVQFSDRMILERVKFYLLEGGKFVSEGKTKEVIIDNRSSNLILRGSIVLVSSLDGTQLFTSEMEWIASERKLQTEDKVIIKRKNLIVEGWGLVANPDLSQVEIKRKATTKLIESS